MRWALVLVGCGRIAFDPLGDTTGDGGGGGDGDGGGGGDGSITGDGATACINTYMTGGTAFQTTATNTADVMMPANNDPNAVLVIGINWDATTGTINSITDTNGNTYMPASSQTGTSVQAQVMWYARYGVGGTGTATVSFNVAVPGIDILYALYRDIDLATPFAGGVTSNTGNGTTAMASASNISSNAMVVAMLASNTSAPTADPAFARRAGVNGSLLQDRCATPGSHAANATLSASGNWIMHLVPLRAR